MAALIEFHFPVSYYNIFGECMALLSHFCSYAGEWRQALPLSLNF